MALSELIQYVGRSAGRRDWRDSLGELDERWMYLFGGSQAFIYTTMIPLQELCTVLNLVTSYDGGSVP